MDGPGSEILGALPQVSVSLIDVGGKAGRLGEVELVSQASQLARQARLLARVLWDLRRKSQPSKDPSYQKAGRLG